MPAWGRRAQASAEAVGIAASGALPLRVVDGLLAPPLLAALQAAMGPGSPFWPAHGYPTPAFFSYNAPLAGAAAGPRSGGAQQPPGGELIAAAAEALLPLAMDLLDAPPPDPAPGAPKRAAPVPCPHPPSPPPTTIFHHHRRERWTRGLHKTHP